MTSYFIKNFDGGDICIVENDNRAASVAILFVHGSNLNSDIFKHQFESPLLGKYRLIAINMPGNGKSPKANAPEEVYQFKGLVKTLEHCVSKLDLPSDIFVVGHSMGAHLVTNNRNSPNIYKGAFFVGYPPLHEVADFYNATVPIPSLPLLFSETLDESASAQVADDLMSGKGSDVDISAMIQSIDPVFRRVYGSSIANGVLCDEYETLHRFKQPVAISHAEDDRFLKYDYIRDAPVSNLWESRIHLFRKASHIPFIDAADAINQLIDDYVSSLAVSAPYNVSLTVAAKKQENNRHTGVLLHQKSQGVK